MAYPAKQCHAIYPAKWREMANEFNWLRWRERERVAILIKVRSWVEFRNCDRSKEESSQPNCHQKFKGIRFSEKFISRNNSVICDMNPMF
jgi:hypothetical protein